MSPAERLRAAYKIVDEAAPGLALGNDPASGYSIIARVAIVQLTQLTPTKALALLKGWTKEAEDRLGTILSPEAN